MNRLSSGLLGSMLGLCLVAGLYGSSAGSAAVSVGAAARATTVLVTAGKPSEFAFKLSKSSALPWAVKSPSGTVVFRVRNKGAIPHSFKVCTTPAKSASLLTCNGKSTKVLSPGQSTTLTVTFKKRGTYEYLCAVPGHAAAGMKGLLGVGVKVSAAPTSTIVAVAAGQPSELAFKVSQTSSIPAGKVVFKVVNVGKIPHTFEICLTPTTAASNTCKGKGVKTPLLQPGKSATITVSLTKKGTYEFLCTVPGHAAAGMKGLLGIGVKVKEPALPPTTTSTPTTTTPPTTTTTSSSGTNPDLCPTGVTIVTSGNTDNDLDENGQPTDGDGCV